MYGTSKCLHRLSILSHLSTNVVFPHEPNESVQCDGVLHYAERSHEIVQCDGDVQCDVESFQYVNSPAVESNGAATDETTTTPPNDTTLPDAPGHQTSASSMAVRPHAHDLPPRPAVDAEANPDSANLELVCVACFERLPNQLMLPCRHFCLCAECVKSATTNGRCPMCTTEFTEVMEVYLP